VPRKGILVNRPYERLTQEQVELIHQASMQILTDPGLISFNREAVNIFHSHGAVIESIAGDHQSWQVKIPEQLVLKALDTAPKTVKLGARNPDNTLIMHGEEIRVPEFKPRRGTLDDLCQSAHVCEHLETVDGYIRTVNIQDRDITGENKDVNKYFASLNNNTKHFMSGLTSLKQLDNVVRMAELIAGGKKALEDNPIISFITCLVKSPLQFVEDTTDTFIEVCRRGLPIVVSSSPQAGTTAPIKEAGIMAQINAEVLAGITLGQLVKPGTPVLYGSVPVRARMDTLGDSYGSVETSQYNIDCVQMARFYRLPNYSTSGVCDPKIPGEQSSIERLFSDIVVTMSGPQFLHCAFGLLDCNSIFCLLQAVLDDAHFKMIEFFLRQPKIGQPELGAMLKQIQGVVATPQKLYISHIRPVLRSGEISGVYPFEGSGQTDDVFELAYERMKELLARPVEHIDRETTTRIFEEIPGLLPRLNIYESRS
jgi:trimethylamine--corrinoid protein Co-methyltransferase